MIRSVRPNLRIFKDTTNNLIRSSTRKRTSMTNWSRIMSKSTKIIKMSNNNWTFSKSSPRTTFNPLRATSTLQVKFLGSRRYDKTSLLSFRKRINLWFFLQMPMRPTKDPLTRTTTWTQSTRSSTTKSQPQKRAQELSSGPHLQKEKTLSNFLALWTTAFIQWARDSLLNMMKIILVFL